MTLPPRLARLGRTIEFRIAPPLYRSSQHRHAVASRRRTRSRAGCGSGRRTSRSCPPGIDPSFTPGRQPVIRSPLVVAVGRLVPVKRFDALIDALADVKPRRPDLRAVIVGEGYERDALERRIAELGAGDWISLPGRVDDATLLDLYRRAWVLASASRHEGWGMTITEAAACRTPAVATRIAGHSDAIVDGTTGLLVDDDKALAAAHRPRPAPTTRSVRCSPRTRSSTRRDSRGRRPRAARSRYSRPRRCVASPA